MNRSLSSIDFSHRMITFIGVCVFFLFLFNVNLSVIGGPSFITTVRLGFVTLSLAVIALWYLEGANRKKITITGTANLITIIILFHILISLLLSALMNVGDLQSDSIVYIFSAILQLFSFVLFLLLSKYFKPLLFIRLFLLMTLMTMVFIAAFIYNEVGNFNANLFVLRRFLNDSLPQGLNRFLNGLSVLVVLPLAFVIGVLKGTRFELLVSYFIVFSAVVFSMLAGSRQFFLSLVVTAVLLILLLMQNSQMRIRFILLGPVLFAIFFVLMYAFVPIEFYDFLVSRIYDTTYDQLSEGSSRIDRYLLMVQMLDEQPIFGIGPGLFYEYTGLYADSGFLQFTVENGLFQALLHVSLIIGLITYLSRRIFMRSSYSNIFFIAFLVSICINNVFNELFLEHYIWLIIPIIGMLNDLRMNDSRKEFRFSSHQP